MLNFRSCSRMAKTDNALGSAICLLAEKLTQERVDRLDPARDMFERLAKIKPPYFKGKMTLPS